MKPLLQVSKSEKEIGQASCVARFNLTAREGPPISHCRLGIKFF